jgi:hypothetical protein
LKNSALAIQPAIGNWKSKMFCPSCDHDNIEGVDRCEECMTPLLSLDVPRAESARGLARSVMEDKLNQLEQEFLGVVPEAPVSEVIRKMKEARLGCALVLNDGKLVGRLRNGRNVTVATIERTRQFLREQRATPPSREPVEAAE